MANWPASLKTSIVMSLRKSRSDVSTPEPKFHTLFAHFSNSVSCVTPRSRVIGSYSVRPGDLRLLLGSPPSRCLITSVVRLSMPILHTAATYLLSHLTRNLKFLYGSKRWALTLNAAIGGLLHGTGSGGLPGHLLDRHDDELGRLQRREADDDVDSAEVGVGRRGGLGVALDEVRLA